jgi:pimeloyl-ACP methyl ester carboxylesterase
MRLQPTTRHTVGVTEPDQQTTRNDTGIETGAVSRHPKRARRGLSLRRWAKRIGIGVLALIVVVVAGGSGYEAIARHQAASDYPPRGRMIDIGGRSIHLDCRGTGSPTVVFESGLDISGSLDWDLVHDQIATTTRACAYDRAGIMWSDPKSSHQNGDAVAEDLHATLAASGEKGPFVLVGHSMGGPYATIYTKKHPGQVAGLVLVDASHPDQEQRFSVALKEPMATAEESRAPASQRIPADHLAWTGVGRLMPATTVTGGDTAFPADMVAKALAYLPTSASAALDERDAVRETVKQAGTFRDFGDRPMVILCAGRPASDKDLKASGQTRKYADTQQSVWQALHVEESSWSTRGRLVLVPDSRHYIQIDRPDVVIAAVRDVVASVRNPSAPFNTATTTE